jgi:2-alkenal reductase
MTRTRQIYALMLFVLLLLTSLACQFSAVDPESVTVVNTDAVIESAVATIQAQIPTPVPVVISGDGGETAVTTAVLSTDLQEQLVTVYERVNPAVVQILVYSSFNDQRFPIGTGSGFVYDDQGYVVTNNHVVADGDTYEVIFPSGFRSPATLSGADTDSDLAVVRAENMPEDVTPLPLGDLADLHVGQFVIAIGSPFGETGSMSIGIISGLGRTLDSQRPVEGGGRYSLPQVIQTDAAINPGNSGGPLLDLQGRVVGVNSAIRTDTGTNSGVGFSIPVNAVKRIVPSLISEGQYIYPYLGIRMQSLDLPTAEDLGIPYSAGAYVIEVSSGTPAAEAGLIASGTNGFQPLPGGDLIIAINDNPVRNSNDLISYLVFETAVGETVNLTVVRNGEEVDIPLTLGERP